MNPDDEPLVALSWAANGVALVTIERPKSLNALTIPAVRQLAETLRAVGVNPSCRVVVVTGVGSAFCAGADFALFQSSRDRGAQPGAPAAVSGRRGETGGMLDEFLGVVRAMRTCRAPVIAAVNGVAVGAGMALAVAADARVMARSATFRVGTVKVGLSGGEAGLSWLLPRYIGVSRAMEILVTGRPLGAEEAFEIGLVSAVAEDDECVAAALALAEQICANSPTAVWLTKQVVWANQEASFAAAREMEARAQALAATTADFREAISAFKEKRKPVFDPERAL
jgi:enoyl-CoA hydratase